MLAFVNIFSRLRLEMKLFSDCFSSTIYAWLWLWLWLSTPLPVSAEPCSRISVHYVPFAIPGIFSVVLAILAPDDFVRDSIVLCKLLFQQLQGIFH